MSRTAYGPKTKKEASTWWGTVKTVLIAALIALGIRTFAYEPFHIPSGSMIPSLLVGDYLLISKFSYGYSQYSFPGFLIPFSGRILGSEPERGDVIVFQIPSDPYGYPYIKRLIGMPGDRVQVTNGRLIINGEEVPREELDEADFSYLGESGEERRSIGQLYRETLPNGASYTILEESDTRPLDNTEEFVVPEGHYFFMGDNRDNSQDSRVGHNRPGGAPVGFVPFENLVGRADVIWFSLEDAAFYEVWRWPTALRFGRLLNGVE